MRRLIALLLCLLCPTSFAVSQYESHFNVRMAIVDAQKQLLGTGHVLLVGDSNREEFWWNYTGPCYNINAGMGGATISDIASRAAAMAANTQPHLTFISIGTNDLQAGSSNAANWASIPANIRAIVNAFTPYGRVVVFPVPPFGPGFANSTVGGASQALADRADINAMILTGITGTGASWDWAWPNTITIGGTGDGNVTNAYAVPGALQGDDTHFSPATQYSLYLRDEVWRQYLGVGC